MAIAEPRPRFSSNYVRTAMLMAALIVLLGLVGRAVGGVNGMAAFLAIGVVMNFVMYWFSDRIALAAHRAQPVTAAEAPTLYAIVERLTRRAGLPMPRIFVIPSSAANAFATGRNPAHAAVAVTDGIMQILNERELEAVLGHELSHVKNRDVLIATIAAGVAGIISGIGHIAIWFGGGSRDGNRGGGLAALAWLIVAPLLALLIQLAISRSREYGADASGAALVGDPEALASALARLEQGQQRHPYEFAGPATAHLFIVNPLRGRSASIMNLLSTHPPIEERIRRLQEMRT
ncbi:MAG TPA: zinc metalloprotease HtpX [Polyangia bacterium]